MLTRTNWKHEAALRMLATLWAQVPVFAIIAIFFDSGVFSTLLLGALVLAGPTLAYLSAPGSRLCAVMLGAGTMGMSALLIHVGHGMIEMHFHVFAMLAVLVLLGDFAAILAAAGTTAVHHILFWLVLPASVFNYQAGFGIVLIHATFVVVETIPLVYISRLYGKARDSESITAAELPAASEQVGAATSAISQLGTRLSEAACEQRAATEETIAAVEQISASAKSNAQSAAESSRLVDDLFLTRLGAADQTATAMTAKMTAIRDSSSKINAILSTIDGIAFQTNILALNAAIEAARAGEAGLGFGVVADEVRALAQRCADAAQNTRVLIETSVKDSLAASEHMEELGAAIRAITQETARFHTLTENIRTSSEEQSKAIASVARGQQSIGQASEQVAQLALEASQSSDSLQEQAEKLHGLVNCLH